MASLTSFISSRFFPRTKTANPTSGAQESTRDAIKRPAKKGAPKAAKRPQKDDDSSSSEEPLSEPFLKEDSKPESPPTCSSPKKDEDSMDVVESPDVSSIHEPVAVIKRDSTRAVTKKAPPTTASRIKKNARPPSSTAAKKNKGKKHPLVFSLTRPSRHPLKSERTRRPPFPTEGLLPVPSLWKPRIKPSMTLAHDGAADRAQKQQERDERLQTGLPRNVKPVFITTKYRQFKLSPEDLLAGCRTDKDRDFMKRVSKNGRLLTIDRWKCYTLVQGETFNHDMGVFVALDLALMTLMLNFYTDMRHLMKGRRQKIRVSDVQYLIDHVWSNRVMNSYKILKPHFKTTAPVRVRHRNEEEQEEEGEPDEND